jgi:hypothetical protein
MAIMEPESGTMMQAQGSDLHLALGFSLWNPQPCRYRVHANLIDN